MICEWSQRSFRSYLLESDSEGSWTGAEMEGVRRTVVRSDQKKMAAVVFCQQRIVEKGVMKVYC